MFEVERPATLEWKRERLMQVGSGIGPNLRFVPVDFERGESWVAQLTSSGFLRTKPAVIASTGVSMYLTHDAIAAMLHEVASLAAGSTFVMSFMLPIELADPDVRSGIEAAAKGARPNGTPFISFYRPLEMLELARAAGFREVNHVSAAALAERFSRGGATVCARRTTPRNCWWRRADSAPVFGVAIRLADVRSGIKVAKGARENGTPNCWWRRADSEPCFGVAIGLADPDVRPGFEAA